MNRKQEVVVWIVGVALAGLSMRHGHRHSIWFLEVFMPLALLGVLLVFGLRDRRMGDSTTPRTLLAIVGLFVGGGLVASGSAETEDALYDLGQEIQTVQAQIEETQRDVRDVERSVDGLRFSVDAIEDAVRY